MTSGVTVMCAPPAQPSLGSSRDQTTSPVRTSYARTRIDMTPVRKSATPPIAKASSPSAATASALSQSLEPRTSSRHLSSPGFGLDARSAFTTREIARDFMGSIPSQAPYHPSLVEFQCLDRRRAQGSVVPERSRTLPVQRRGGALAAVPGAIVLARHDRELRADGEGRQIERRGGLEAAAGAALRGAAQLQIDRRARPQGPDRVHGGEAVGLDELVVGRAAPLDELDLAVVLAEAQL